MFRCILTILKKLLSPFRKARSGTYLYIRVFISERKDFKRVDSKLPFFCTSFSVPHKIFWPQNNIFTFRIAESSMEFQISQLHNNFILRSRSPYEKINLHRKIYLRCQWRQFDTGNCVCWSTGHHSRRHCAGWRSFGLQLHPLDGNCWADFCPIRYTLAACFLRTDALNLFFKFLLQLLIVSKI